MRPEDIARGRQQPMPMPMPIPQQPQSQAPQYDPTHASTFSTGSVVRSPQTLAEWRLCKPGDTIELLGFTVEITEQNYEKFMDEIMWYVNWFQGDLLGKYMIPNPNPSGRARFSQALTNTYIASGIVKVLSKYSKKEDRPGFFERMRLAFGGRGVPIQ